MHVTQYQCKVLYLSYGQNVAIIEYLKSKDDFNVSVAVLQILVIIDIFVRN